MLNVSSKSSEKFYRTLNISGSENIHREKKQPQCYLSTCESTGKIQMVNVEHLPRKSTFECFFSRADEVFKGHRITRNINLAK